MSYFNGISHVSKMLTDEATKELDSQKTFLQKLKDTSKALGENMGDLDLYEEMGFDMLGETAMDHFAESVEILQNDLIKECARVIREAHTRKEQLRRAVIWGDL